MAEASDMDLLREYANHNSQDAFAELVRHHINLVYSAALRHVKLSAYAEEVTQAVFIILAQKAAGLRPGVVLEAWLYQTTRLTSLSLLRRERRRQFREQEAYMRTVIDQSDETVMWHQLAPLLDEALTHLGAKDREAVILRFFKEMDLRGVAGSLSITEAAAQRRVYRAVEKLQKFFLKRGISSTAALITGALSSNSLQAAPAGLANSVTTIAMAKGAAASFGTLALIKTTSNIMAWTKTKIVIVATVTTLTAVAGTIATVAFFHLGSGETTRAHLPTGKVKPMMVYSYSRCAFVLASDGSLWSWGEEYLGWPVLGYKNTNIDCSTVLRRIGHDTDWTSISTADNHSLAIKSDGTLWAWGANYGGQLGDGTKVNQPVPVPAIPGNDWKQTAAGGNQYNLALKTDGTLWAWGQASSGELGLGDTKKATNAMQVGNSSNWVKIFAGGDQCAGIQSDGTLWFWGSLYGNGNNEQEDFRVPTRMSPDTNWTDVCFAYFTVLAIKADGTLWCWGNEANFYTEAKDDSLNDRPGQVGKETDWQSCSSSPGCMYTLLCKKDGTLWALDASGHRTIKPGGDYPPIKLEKIETDKDILAFLGAGDDIGAILTSNGEVWTWGRVLGEYHKPERRRDQTVSKRPTYRQEKTPWQLSVMDAAD